MAHDMFRDITHGGAFGIFDKDQAALESGMEKVNGVSSVPEKDGVALDFTCNGCGNSQRVTLEWPEVIAMKYGLSPHHAYAQAKPVQCDPSPWGFDREDGGWQPLFKCGCGWHLGMRIGPDEFEKWLRVARRSGLIQKQVEHACNQFIDQLMRHMQMQRQGALPGGGMVR